MAIQSYIEELIESQNTITSIYKKIKDEILQDLAQIELEFKPKITKVFTNTTDMLMFRTEYDSSDKLNELIVEHNERFRYITRHFEPMYSRNYYWDNGFLRACDIDKDSDGNKVIVNQPKLDIECTKEDSIILRNNELPENFVNECVMQKLRDKDYKTSIEHEKAFENWQHLTSVHWNE